MKAKSNPMPAPQGPRKPAKMTMVGWMVVILCGGILLCGSAGAQSAAPFISIGLDQEAEPGKVAMVMQLFLLMTVLSLAPSILIMLTSP